ncbi:MAG: RNA polymerase factor sigma-54 [Hyphomicrobiales bacterium]|nr:RNA polymerase factor sigma-54 [Hyphomicrobiales bacterium]
MAIGPRLDLRQSQSLVMTPQLQQAIKLLQFSSLELNAYVENQLEQNPLLDREDSVVDRYDAEHPAEASEGETAIGGAADPPPLDEAMSVDNIDAAEAMIDVDVREGLFEGERSPADGVPMDGSELAWRNHNGDFDSSETNLEETLAGQKTLKDHILSQVLVDIRDPSDRIIAAHLIDLLDEAGYLSGELQDVAVLLGCSLDRVETVLKRLQSFDPPGVFARDLAECLTLQLLDRGRLQPHMGAILQHLPLVGRRDWPALCKICDIDSSTLFAAIAEIRTLNPKPAVDFETTIGQPITPDVFVRLKKDQTWAVELNADALPRVLVNNQYYSEVSQAVRNKHEKQYMSDCLQSANWLVKALHQRATTILKVSTEIVRHQNGFFHNGVRSLRPLILRDIADAVSMHESTVSRVTSNKYISTPRGIFELKFFFTHAVGGSNGDEAHSAAAVKDRIKSLIDEEPSNRVLSDDALAALLQKEGIDIARRTVAKYREALGIASSMMRRRQKCELR